MKRSQAGFTLIELIIVIVILGILAVTAAPKFLDFGSDARKSVLQGVKGSLESAGSLVYGKAIIAGKQSAATETLTDPAINIVYGYPESSIAAISAVAELSTAEWAVLVATADQPVGAAAGDIVIAAAGATITTLTANACHVLYKPVITAGNKPVITVFSTGC